MMPPSDTVLVIGADASDTLPEGVTSTLRSAGLGLHRSTASSGPDTLQAWMTNGMPPPAVLLTDDLKDPLAIARQVHQVAPLVQIVFLAGRERSEALRRDMALAPMIGNHWTILDPDLDSLPRALKAAVRSTRQRSNLRTTLDRMNLKLQEGRSAPDTATYRRLVVSDRYLANILEYAGDAILAIDRHDRIAMWNRGASRLFGYEETTASGRTIDLLVSDDRTHELLTLVRKARAGQPVQGHAIECMRSDATRFDAEMTVAPVRDEAGPIEAVSLIARDVTERNRYQADLEEANRNLTRALAMLEANQQELLDLNAKLEIQATTDALTGLKNRIVFHNSLVEMIAVAARQGTPLSLLIVDVDHFKRINDTWGHLEGDRVLRAIAAGLRHHTRDQDVVARFGGEEFAILLPSTSLTDAMAVAENLRVSCRNLVDIESELTVSVGAAAYVAGDTDVTLIGRADKALYASKAAGRNRVTLAEDPA